MSHPETPEERRAGLLASVIVGGLGVLACGLYLWLLSFEPGVAASLARSPSAYAGWIALTAAQGVLLRWHRRAPMRVLGAVFALYLMATWLLGEAGSGSLSLPLWFAVFALAAYGRLAAGLILVGVIWIAHAAWQALLYWALGIGPVTVPVVALLVIQQGLFYVVCTAVGLSVRGNRQRADAAAERARLIQESAEARAAAAVAAERNRMARELHDLAAHQLVDVVLTARTAKLEPGGSSDALDEIIVKGSEALDTLRSSVTALRADDVEPAADEPLTRRIDKILSSARATRAMVVDSVIDPTDLDATNPAQRQTVERVLTEALANAHAHAPGEPVSLRIGRSADVLHVEVTNPLATSPSHATVGTGVGLIGAAERAALLNGTFTAGPDGAGSWRLALRLPASANANGGAR